MDSAQGAYTNGERSEQDITCMAIKLLPPNGIWQEKSPIDYSLVLFFIQIIFAVLTKQLLVYVLKPLRQPTFIAEVLAGVMLGPTVLGHLRDFWSFFFPDVGIPVLETLSYVGVLYYIFLVAVKMDISILKSAGLKPILIALACVSLPVLIGYHFSVVVGVQTYIGHRQQSRAESLAQSLVLGVTFSMTAFPVIVRIVTDLKLLHSEVGKISMASAFLIEMFSWIILVIAMPMTDNTNSWDESAKRLHRYAPWLALLSGAVFVVIAVLVIRPFIGWLVRRNPDGNNFNHYLISVVLVLVLLCSVVAEYVGMHAIFGAFVFGLVIPSGTLGPALVEKAEDFVTELFVPLYYVINGLRTNPHKMSKHDHWMYLMGVAVGVSAIKVSAVFLIGIYNNMNFRDGITLGLLLNARGLLNVVILNLAMDAKILDQDTFTFLVIDAVVMTAIVSPILTMIHKSARSFTIYKHRTMQKISKENAPLRMLVCIHTPRNVPAIINLLETSHPNKDSPIAVYGLHLVELTDRTSAMLVVHTNNARKSKNQTQADQVIHNAFQNYEQNTANVSVQTLTSISSYATVHEDICTLAEDKHITFILLPFHKQQTIDGAMEINPAFRTINQNVLANAPCSVGILLDRGFTTNNTSHHIAMLFFGGPDDREALSYARRMAEQPEICLTVLRFLPGEELKEEDSYQQRSLIMLTETDRDRQHDDDFIRKFRMKTASDETIVYKETTVNSVEEAVEAIRSLESIHDLYMVGRGQSMSSELTTGLSEWSECPELGVIGDMLVSSDFGATMSVLVVQQYGVGSGIYGGSGLGTPDSQQSSEYQFNKNFNRVSSRRRAQHMP